MKVDRDPRLPTGGGLGALIVRLYEVLRFIADAINERDLVYPEFLLTDAATITIDASVARNCRVTLGGNRTIANPTNVAAGNVINLAIKQDGTGSRTLTWGSEWDWGTAGTPTLSTGASKVDFVSAYRTDAHSKWIAIFWKAA